MILHPSSDELATVKGAFPCWFWVAFHQRTIAPCYPGWQLHKPLYALCTSGEARSVAPRIAIAFMVWFRSSSYDCDHFAFHNPRSQDNSARNLLTGRSGQKRDLRLHFVLYRPKTTYKWNLLKLLNNCRLSRVTIIKGNGIIFLKTSCLGDRNNEVMIR